MSDITGKIKKSMGNARKKKRYPAARLGDRLGERLSVYVGWFVLAIFTIHPLMIRLPRKVVDTITNDETGAVEEFVRYVGNGYTNITETKGTTFIVILLCAVFLMLCAVAYTLMLGHTPKLRLKERLRSLRPYEIAILAYWLIALVSACTSENLHTAFMGASLRNEGFWFQTAYIAAFLMVARWYKPKTRDFVVLICTAILIAFYILPQYYGYDLLHFYPNELPPRSKIMFIGTMSNINVASTYYGIVFVICSVLFVQHTSDKLRRFLFPCALLLFYIVLLGDTESVQVGLIAVVMVAFPFVAKDKKTIARTLLLGAGCALVGWINMVAHRAYFLGDPQFAVLEPLLPIVAGVFAALAALVRFLPIKKGLPAMVWRVGWLTMVVVILVGAVLAMPILAEKTGNRSLQEAASVLKGNFDPNFGSKRFLAWGRAIDMFKQKPILGHGPDNFGHIYTNTFTLPEYQELLAEAAAKGIDPSTVDNPTTFDKAHNEYFQALVDVGILGLAAILVFYGLLLYAVFRRHLNNPVVLALGVALGCFLVQAFFNFSTPFAHPVTWTCWGMLAAAMRNAGVDVEGEAPAVVVGKKKVVSKS